MTAPAGTNLVASQLIESCQGLVRNMAWRIHQRLPSSVELDDLIGYGQLGLAQAAASFDPTKGNRFTTFAYFRIRGSILDGLSEMSWFKRADFYAARYERMAEEFLDGADGRVETGSDGGLRDDARWLTDVGSRMTMVYLASGFASDEDEGRSFATEDAAAVSPQAALMLSEAGTVLRELIQDLPDQARELINLTYVKGLTLKDAGERVGISKSWASRLHDRTLRQLAFGMRNRGAGLPA